MHSSTKNAEGGELEAGEWGWGAEEFGSGARGEELGEIGGEGARVRGQEAGGGGGGTGKGKRRDGEGGIKTEW